MPLVHAIRVYRRLRYMGLAKLEQTLEQLKSSHPDYSTAIADIVTRAKFDDHYHPLYPKNVGDRVLVVSPPKDSLFLEETYRMERNKNFPTGSEGDVIDTNIANKLGVRFANRGKWTQTWEYLDRHGLDVGLYQFMELKLVDRTIDAKVYHRLVEEMRSISSGRYEVDLPIGTQVQIVGSDTTLGTNHDREGSIEAKQKDVYSIAFARGCTYDVNRQRLVMKKRPSPEILEKVIIEAESEHGITEDIIRRDEVITGVVRRLQGRSFNEVDIKGFLTKHLKDAMDIDEYFRK